LTGARFDFNSGRLRDAVVVFLGDPLPALMGDFLGAAAGTVSARSIFFLGDLGKDLVGLGGGDSEGI